MLHIYRRNDYVLNGFVNIRYIRLWINMVLNCCRTGCCLCLGEGGNVSKSVGINTGSRLAMLNSPTCSGIGFATVLPCMLTPPLALHVPVLPMIASVARSVRSETQQRPHTDFLEHLLAAALSLG